MKRVLALLPILTLVACADTLYEAPHADGYGAYPYADGKDPATGYGSYYGTAPEYGGTLYGGYVSPAPVVGFGFSYGYSPWWGYNRYTPSYHYFGRPRPAPHPAPQPPPPAPGPVAGCNPNSRALGPVDPNCRPVYPGLGSKPTQGSVAAVAPVVPRSGSAPNVAIPYRVAPSQAPKPAGVAGLPPASRAMPAPSPQMAPVSRAMPAPAPMMRAAPAPVMRSAPPPAPVMRAAPPAPAPAARPAPVIGSTRQPQQQRR
ncbi:MAG: hypothetical protein IT557_07795 [Alphaproteobacteria bacterium]|nr:hypothetical protein [Alphaproteobacteria bacterium]